MFCNIVFHSLLNIWLLLQQHTDLGRAWGRKEEEIMCVTCSPGYVLLAEHFRSKFRQGAKLFSLEQK
jgi:hypothetical protein